MARQPIIIDTDLGPDDWAAIAYLMSQSQFDIRAITIEGSGESDCSHGIPNLSKALQYWQRTDIPIACNSKLGLYKSRFPKAWRNRGSDFFKKLRVKPCKSVTVKSSAPHLLNQTIQEAEQPVVVLALGPLINIYEAIRLNPSLWQTRIKTVYFSGGYFNNGPTALAKYYPETKHHARSWNLFIAPYSGSKVFQFPLPFVLNVQDLERKKGFKCFKSRLYNNLLRSHKRHQLNQFGEVAFGVQSQTDSYWDDAFTAMMFVEPENYRFRGLNMIVMYRPFKNSGVSTPDKHGRRVIICESPQSFNFFIDRLLSSFKKK